VAATGATVRERTVETCDELTAQEALIARLARAGLSDPEIGAQLLISARTVEWHVRKVFTKLGIRSRAQLHAALGDPQLPISAAADAAASPQREAWSARIPPPPAGPTLWA
jgi:DNA-binding NarL/FixJ family response regulator